MSKLFLVRHGQSEWNSQNRFTGWVDVELSDQGKNEAKKSGELLNNLNINLDFCYTSFLRRAINTLEIILKELGESDLKFTMAWELNERHYGSLTGLDKDEMKKKLGEELFKKYRRSWDIAPPPMENNNENEKLYSPLNKNIDQNIIPKTESLKDTYERVLEFYKKDIETKISENNILISAHGNSIRALCKYLFKLDENQISKLEIPTGNPLLITLDGNKKITDCKYLDHEKAKDLVVF